MYSKELLNFFTQVQNKKIVVFGTGPTAKEFFQRLPVSVAYITDNEKSQWGKELNGVKICDPKVLLNEDKTKIVVIIASKGFAEILNQLKNYGFEEGKNFIVSPFILVENGVTMDMQPNLLVSCVGADGGLFLVNPNNKSVEKILDNDCRGLVKHKDFYLVVLEHAAVVKLDLDFKEIDRYNTPEDLQLHGISLHENQETFYLCETRYDRIGIYDTKSLKRIDEINISRNGFESNTSQMDSHNINDVLYKNGKIYLSMFSINGVYRHEIWNDGGVLIVNPESKAIEKRVLTGLNQPHTLYIDDGKIYFCNSMECQVRIGDKIMCQFFGYTRGLALKDEYFFIGQSRMRRLSRFRDRFMNLSMDCGVHIFNSSLKTCTFIQIPSEGVFDILTLS